MERRAILEMYPAEVVRPVWQAAHYAARSARSCRSRWEALKAAVMAETADIETTIQAIRSRRNRSTHRRSSVAGIQRRQFDDVWR